jgi:hypothetical protein
VDGHVPAGAAVEDVPEGEEVEDEEEEEVEVKKKKRKGDNGFIADDDEISFASKSVSTLKNNKIMPSRTRSGALDDVDTPAPVAAGDVSDLSEDEASLKTMKSSTKVIYSVVFSWLKCFINVSFSPFNEQSRPLFLLHQRRPLLVDPKGDVN